MIRSVALRTCSMRCRRTPPQLLEASVAAAGVAVVAVLQRVRLVVVLVVVLGGRERAGVGDLNSDRLIEAAALFQLCLAGFGELALLGRGNENHGAILAAAVAELAAAVDDALGNGFHVTSTTVATGELCRALAGVGS